LFVGGGRGQIVAWQLHLAFGRVAGIVIGSEQ
jgi:hypothetical protein